MNPTTRQDEHVRLPSPGIEGRAPASFDAGGGGDGVWTDVGGLTGCRRCLGPGDILFRGGQPFATLYRVVSGELKTWRPDHRGQPCVTAFAMSGDLLGMDAIGEGRHSCTAAALDDSVVEEISYARLQEVLTRSPQLMHRFHCAMSREIEREQATLKYASAHGAARLAGFLMDLSARYAERGLPAHQFRLRMSRADIGSHLGLTIESVSRLLTRFRDQGWIAVDRRQLELRAPKRLAALLAAMPAPSAPPP
ncbi:helix-turn-helix domain-containing protein [Massilia sp. ST3]|uniref:helix-turn-helix domain-containing protein n=1 Tax=Massilia sp. ST3 TaxID=2824903 RepID=UPI001B821188|nr:helix-turn-helix domain-containing protein [Massilia sp. ST3]MBQ5948487.1 helix-turn-helix domain-containing protein [Massilia sp. ST3]